jgi:hypothetical protein
MRISTLVIALAGFVAGMVGSRLATVHAQGSAIDTFQCKNYVLMDGAGHKRGEWKVDPSGQPVLRLFDAQGRVTWQTGKAGPQLLHEP